MIKTIKLDKNIMSKIESNDVKARDMVEYVLGHCEHQLHFKIRDIKGDLTRENVYSQLSLNQLYNDDEKNIKRAIVNFDYNTLELYF